MPDVRLAIAIALEGTFGGTVLLYFLYLIYDQCFFSIWKQSVNFQCNKLFDFKFMGALTTRKMKFSIKGAVMQI